MGNGKPSRGAEEAPKLRKPREKLPFSLFPFPFTLYPFTNTHYLYVKQQTAFAFHYAEYIQQQVFGIRLPRLSLALLTNPLCDRLKHGFRG